MNKHDKKEFEKQEAIVSVRDTDIPEGKMFIKVYAPFKNYFEGIANSISAVNETGPFDVLSGHHKFLTLLNPCDLNIIKDDGAEKISIERGVMYVKTDRVTVFLDV